MMKNLLITSTLFAMALVLQSTAIAQTPGTLDMDFANEGIAIQDNVGADGEIYNDVITLSDDKVLMVGYSDTDNQDIILAKFNADGTPDESFGNLGFNSIDASLGANEQAWGATELPNGKILITGIIVREDAWNGFVMRLLPDGNMDASFGTQNGFTEFNAGDNAISVGVDVLSPSGNDILVAGNSLVDGQLDITVFKFTQGGGALTSFGTDGVVFFDGSGQNDELSAMALSDNGQIFLAGSSENAEGAVRGIIVKLTAFGTPTSFGGGIGAFLFDEDAEHNSITDVKITNDNKVIAVGTSGAYPNVDGYVFRLESDGDLDPTFSDDGYQSVDPGSSIALRLNKVLLPSSGGILATGYLEGDDNAAYAYAMNDDGSNDFEFGENGHVILDLDGDITNLYVRGAALQSDGGIFLGGDFTTQEIINNRLILMKLHGHGTNGLLSFQDYKLDVKVYPNPTLDVFSIDLPQTENMVRIELINMNGEVLSQWNSTQKAYEIPNHISNGNYILKMSTNGNVYTTKLTVIK